MKLRVAKIQHREGTERVGKHYAYADEDASEVEKSFVSGHGAILESQNLNDILVKIRYKCLKMSENS